MLEMSEDAQMEVSRSDDEVKVTIKAPTAEHLDMQDRDPTRMNDLVKVQFAEVFAEPEGMHSFDGVWLWSYKCFVGTKFWCYKICTLICALPFAFCWGIHFACLTFWHVWYIVPCTKVYLISIYWFRKLWEIYIKCYCDPQFDSCSRFLSNIKVWISKD
ncbi:caveolin-3-like isoform X2 [Glandiceps talaboti]